MPTLDWIGKDKIVSHHQEVPVHEFVHQYGFTVDGKQESPTNSNNMIIHGDNLIALKSLLPKYEGRVDLIYIDPPYNTGNENWVYNDNVNDPRIVKWLGKVVGKDEDDFTRHDKWLCMMYPRLQLLKKLMSPDGFVFISIDENELYHLKTICDEIFGLTNFVGQWNWFKSATPPNLSKKIKRNIEYIICYQRGCLNLFREVNNEPLYTFPDSIILPQTCVPLRKSLYKAEGTVNPFEYRVIQKVADLDNVLFWHRNPSAKGFYINGFINHYPDFIVVTKGGKVIMLETKGDDRRSPESMARLKVGKAWAQLAGNNYRYYMVFDTKSMEGAYSLNQFIDILSQIP